jgi:hypothetical protein
MAYRRANFGWIPGCHPRIIDNCGSRGKEPIIQPAAAGLAWSILCPKMSTPSLRALALFAITAVPIVAQLRLDPEQLIFKLSMEKIRRYDVAVKKLYDMPRADRDAFFQADIMLRLSR